MKSQMCLHTNYTITKASDDVICQIIYDSQWMGGKYKRSLSNIKQALNARESRIVKLVISMHQRASQKQLKGVTVTRKHNLVPDVLLEDFAKLLATGVSTSTFEVNNIAMGNDDTAPAAGDTDLGNETIRANITQTTYLGKIAYFDHFWSSSEVGGNTYKEVGLFVDGVAATPDSGYLLSRVLVDDTLTATETLTINATITLSAA